MEKSPLCFLPPEPAQLRAEPERVVGGDVLFTIRSHDGAYLLIGAGRCRPLHSPTGVRQSVQKLGHALMSILRTFGQNLEQLCLYMARYIRVELA